MSEDSIGASVYSVWNYFFYQTLFIDYTTNGKIESKLVSKDDENGEAFWNLKKRLRMVQNPGFYQYYLRLLHSVATESSDVSNFNKVCAGAYKNYPGKNTCAFNIAMSLHETKKFLTSEVSPDKSNWVWKNLHHNEYAF